MTRQTAQPARRTGPPVEAPTRFLLWLVPTVGKFPRSQKFLLEAALMRQ